MAGANLLKKAADWDSLATGLEAVDGAIRLAVGAGGFDANSLDMTALPSSPWASFGGELAAVRDGEILEIDDDSGADSRSFTLSGGSWGQDLSVGLSVHVKARGVFISSIGQTNNTLRFGDASNNYQVRFGPELIRLVGSSITDFDIAKYPFPALFMSIDSNVASLWIFNTITQVWDLLVSGRTSAAVADDRMAFGAFNTSGRGRSFWKLLQWKAAIEATPFRTTSPVSTMGVVALPIGTIVNGLGDFRTSIAGSATLKAAYNINDAGWSGLFDDIEALNAFLLANPITIIDAVDSIDLRMTHASDGLEQSQFWPSEGPNLTGAGAGGSQAAIEDVRLGTVYNDGNNTGTLIVPVDADVRSGTGVDASVGTLAVAPANDVRDGVPTDDTVGTAAIPDANDVRLNVPTDDTVGNYVPANEDNHALGDSYGSLGIEFTGTKALTPFKLPVDIILEDSEILVFEGAE